MFFLIITVGQECGRRGDDGANPSLGVADVLNTGIPGVTTLQAVKVSGENEFYAFVEVQNISALDGLSTRFCEVANAVVKSRPVIDGGAYGRLLGVPENLTFSNNTISSERLYFEEITVFQGGKTAEEILDLNRQQIELLFTLRQRGELSIVLYKALESNTFFTLVNIQDVAEYDLQSRFYPFYLEHGAYVNVFVKGVQLVSNYVLGGEEAEFS